MCLLKRKAVDVRMNDKEKLRLKDWIHSKIIYGVTLCSRHYAMSSIGRFIRRTMTLVTQNLEPAGVEIPFKR